MSIERVSRTMTPDPELPDPDQPAAERSGEDGNELWSWLPRLSARQTRLEARMARWTADGQPRPWLDWLAPEFRQAVSLGRPEIVWRASGLLRPGLIAQLRWPRYGARLALGLEVPLAHALVDLLLGYDRPLAESRLQLTPVEWGVWSYALVRALNAMCPDPGGPGAGPAPEPAPAPATAHSDFSDLVLDRVGPDAFNVSGLGAIATVLWPVRVKSTTGTARLWLPESFHSLIAADPWGSPPPAAQPPPRAGQLGSLWRAVASEIFLPQGLKRLRKGGVLPLSSAQLSGTPQSPAGPVLLVCDMNDSDEVQCLPAEPVAGSGGRLLSVRGPREVRPRPRHPLSIRINPAMSTNAAQASDREASPTDVPVTLTVELGRVNLTLARLADLKAGDVIELGRHSREPVELTSNGRVVARGELVLIDTDLGVRISHLFL